jgi:hypothetical protein
MAPKTFLRLEGLTVLALALWGYFQLDGPLWLLAVLALAPDLAMVGYLAGPRVGSLSYNVAHTYTLPAVLGVAGFWLGAPLAILIALVWSGHIGADRLVGYGLKYESGFKNTHLSSQSSSADVFTEPSK